MILVHIKNLKKPGSHQKFIINYNFRKVSHIQGKDNSAQNSERRDLNYFGETEELQCISSRATAENIHKQILQSETKSDKDE